MKTIIIIFSLTIFSLGVSAQREGGHHHSYSPRVVVVPSVGFGFGYGYPFMGYPYLGYPYPYNYMSPYYGVRKMPYNLSLEIQSIKIDYKTKIRNARNDKNLGHSQRRQEIRNLKSERDQAIINAQRNFNQRRMNNQNRRHNNNEDSGTGNQFQNYDNSSQ
ncbi:MAG: hypothetical protein Q8891_04845 [Bacteroidota bacterium]|jgi:hypothetical protein|nr:hypothetical protein [Bacteroidota bacterium]